MDEQNKRDFARQLEELTRQSYQEVARMGSISADLTQQRYLLDTIRNQMMELQQAKLAVAHEMLTMIGPPQSPPPLQNLNAVDEFVGRIAERFRPEPDPHPSDPYDIAGWASARRAAE